MSDGYDAVVVGAGQNGLVAANHLADAGWSVLVLEAQPELGGAVHSSRDVHPDFVHDDFSAFYPLAATSPAITSLRLEEHGLVWRRAPSVLAHLMPDDRWAMLMPDREDSAGGLERLQPGDGEAWLELCAQWDRIGEHVYGAMVAPFPPVRAGLGVLRRLPRAGGLDVLRQLLSPVIALGDRRFGGLAPKILLAGSAGHSDIPPNAPGSGLFGLLMTMLGQQAGSPVPEGGSGMLTRAMARRLESRGGEVRCGEEVVEVATRGGRAVGVATASGETVTAHRAVVADVSAVHLYGRLLPRELLPRRVRRGMDSFRLDPSTVKVDWALDGDIPWRAEPPAAVGCFHVADSLAELAVNHAEISGHAVPSAPFLLAGQMTTCDPTRSPAGTQSVWAYAHVPQETWSDAGGEGIRGVWDHDDCERFADRMQRRIEALAPGFGSRVLGRRVLGPRELEARDANLVGGAISGGTTQLDHELVLRPVPGTGRPGTPVRGLFLGSASAHPGGGVHGAAGHNAARAALVHDRLRRPRG